MKIKYFLLLLLLLPFANVFASHVVGGEISYKCIGLRKWEIRLVVYRDCLWTSMPYCVSGSQTSCTRTVTVKPMATIANGGLNPNTCSAPFSPISVTVTSYKIESVSKLIGTWLPDKTNICTNNATTTPGTQNPAVEKYYYIGILDMSSAAYAPASVCPYWEVSWNECCRNQDITNLQNPGFIHFFSNAVINIHHNQASGNCKNSSPVINIQPYMTYCSGIPVEINYGAFDPDNDSLSYRIIKSKGADGVNASYLSPFSEISPFTLYADSLPHSLYSNPNGANVVLDSNNGNISFNAINNHATNIIYGQLALQITQWAKHANGTRYVAGITVGDYQFYIRKCATNKPPKISLDNGSLPAKTTLHYNEPITFSVVAKDEDMGINADSTRFLQWVVSDTNIKVTRPVSNNLHDSLVITFTPNIGLENTQQSITFLAADNNNHPILQSRQMMFRVIDTAGFKTTINTIADACKKYNFSHTNDTNIASVSWQISKTPNDYSLTNAHNFGNVVNTPLLNFTQPGKYLIRLNVIKTFPANSHGFKTDTLVISNNTITYITPNYDSTICKGSKIVFALPLGIYSWFKMPQTTSFAINDTVSVIPDSSINYRYSGFISAGIYNGCTIKDTLNITVLPSPYTNLPDTLQNCNNAIMQLDASNLTNLTTHYLWNTNDTTANISITQAGLYSVSLTQPNGCSAKDSVLVINNATPQINSRTDTAVCWNKPVPIYPQGNATNIQWYNAQTNALLSNSTTFNYTPTTSFTKIRMVAYNGTANCKADDDTVNITMQDKITIVRPAEAKVCEGNVGEVAFKKLVSTNIGNSIWNFNTNPNALRVSNDSAYINLSVLPKVPIAGHTYYTVKYTFSDSIGCSTNDSVNIKLHSTPVVNANIDRSYCNNAGTINLANSQGAIPTGGKFYTVNNNTLLTSVSLNSFSGPYAFYYSVTYTYPEKTCNNTDTFILTSIPLPVLTRPSAKFICDDSSIVTVPAFISSQPSNIGSWSFLQMPSALSVVNNKAYLNIGMLGMPTVNQPKFYWVKYTENNNGCFSIDSTRINVYAKQPVNAGTDKSLCGGDAPFNISLKQLPNYTGGFYLNNNKDTLLEFNPANAILLPDSNKLTYVYRKYYNADISCYSTDDFIYKVTPKVMLQSITGNFAPPRNTTQTYIVDYKPFYTYNWQVNGGVIQSNDSNRTTILWTDTVGTYLKVNVSNSLCGNDSLTKNVAVQGSIGLNEQNNWLQHFMVYPNPATSGVNISFSSTQKEFTLQLFNSTMQQVATMQANSVNGNVTAQFNTKHLSNGLYFIKVSNGTNTKLVKLMIN